MFTPLARLAISTCLLWATASGCEERMNPAAYTQVASVTVYASVDEGARDAFFAQLTSYAEKHVFQFRIAPVRPDGKYFSVGLWREDLQILVGNPFDPPGFQISFYPHKTDPPSPAQLESLIADLKRWISEVQGVAVEKTTKN
jgi:hypothetical protein